MTFERFAVVRVPFTDRGAIKNRPDLVVSDPNAFITPAGHPVMAMITSAANPAWPLDCPIADLSTAGLPPPGSELIGEQERPIADLGAAGLPAPSKVRFKLFTLDHRLVRGRLGRPQRRRRSTGLPRARQGPGTCTRRSPESQGEGQERAMTLADSPIQSRGPT